MRRPGLFWGASLGALLAADYLLDQRHDGSTFSECVRVTYRTHTPTGRAAFVASWVGLSAWFLPHICKAVEGSLSNTLTERSAT